MASCWSICQSSSQLPSFLSWTAMVQCRCRCSVMDEDATCTGNRGTPPRQMPSKATCDQSRSRLSMHPGLRSSQPLCISVRVLESSSSMASHPPSPLAVHWRFHRGSSPTTFITQLLHLPARPRALPDLNTILVGGLPACLLLLLQVARNSPHHRSSLHVCRTHLSSAFHFTTPSIAPEMC